jgi:predicted transcriptional regulator
MAFGWLLVAYGGLQVVRGGLIGGFWYVLIGFFLKRASEGSLSQLKMKKMLETVSVASVMETKFPSLNPRDSLLMVGEELTREAAFTNYPVVEEDRLIGYLSLLELNELKPEIWERGYVRDVLKRDLEGLLIGPQDNAWEALRRMRKRKIGNLFVSTADHLQGIVSLQDLLFFFQNQGRRANPS